MDIKLTIDENRRLRSLEAIQCYRPVTKNKLIDKIK